MAILTLDEGYGIFYDELGLRDSVPILLIHGLNGNSEHWRNVAPRLADAGYRAIWADWPGHHRSDWEIPDFTFDTMVDGFWELVDKLCGEDSRVVVAGHSAGGIIAQLMYHGRPERIAALCLLQTSYGFVRPQMRDIMLSVLEPYSRFLYNPAVRKVYRELDKLSARVAAAIFGEDSPITVTAARGPFESTRETAIEVGRTLIELDIRERLADIAAPTLVVCSTADQIVPREQSETMASEIPNAQLRVINYIGHNGHIMRSGETADAILEFLADVVG